MNYRYKPYDELDIVTKQSDLKITENNGIVKTVYANKTISESVISYKYMIFDFSQF